MITKVIIKNFKRIQYEELILNKFELLVGANNSGKSTVLQALAIWQYCVEIFRQSKRSGGRGIQVVLPNFSALPLPEFILLWNNKTERTYSPKKDEPQKKDQKYIYIEIILYWMNSEGKEMNFGVQLRYQSPQAIYAIPSGGWAKFAEVEQDDLFPYIVYVPPFSGIDPHEQWLDDGNVRQHVGKSQPGSVIRNLLYRVIDRVDKDGLQIRIKDNKDWNEIQNIIKKWFDVDILPPQYEKKISTEIKVEYKANGKSFDIISGGSGFHQILILLAFYYGYDKATTILFDEPDAHLHTNLQRNLLSYFWNKSEKQFIMATHSPEFIGNVDMHNIISMLSGTPKRIDSTEKVIIALSDVDNSDIVRTQDSPFILYLEGEDDNRILASWASVLGRSNIYEKFYPYILNGTSKQDMKNRAEAHFNAMRQINPSIKRAQLLDYDTEDGFHPNPNNPCLKEWKRKNIDNYLLVPSAWKRAVVKQLNESDGSLFVQPYYNIIDDYFGGQNLTLPPKATWRTVEANIFSIIDGKKILFENKDSLFHRIKNCDDKQLIINRQAVASAMIQEEIHQDIISFFDFLENIVQQNGGNSK